MVQMPQRILLPQHALQVVQGGTELNARVQYAIRVKNLLDLVQHIVHILAVSMNNKVLNALAEDTDEKLELCTDPDLKDACLLSSIQGINHFKISAYGTAAAFSNTLGLPKYGGIFHEIEVNEKQIDDRLSQLAEHEINMKAKAPHLLPKDQQYSKGFDLP